MDEFKFIARLFLPAAFLFVAILVFSCGEVGLPPKEEYSSNGSSEPGLSSSSSGILGTSSSSNGDASCEGDFCCGGHEYDNETQFCNGGNVINKCDGNEFDPNKQACFYGELRNNCTHESTFGPCVHDDLMKCKQKGTGEDKIIAPLIKMECKEDGTITGTIEDYRDDEVYNTVQIGSQVWTVENLRYEFTGSLCYDGNPENCNRFGRLYDVTTIPYNYNICPNGFILPSVADWITLINYAGGNSIAGSRLKSVSNWTFNGNGTDSYGFNALPGGYADYGGDEFNKLGEETYWWVRVATGPTSAYGFISSDTGVRSLSSSSNMYRFYVRCLRN